MIGKENVGEIVKFMRFFGILGIVVFHFSDVLKDTYSLPKIFYYVCHIGSQGIHIFFFTSALMLYLKYGDTLIDFQNFSSWFLKRLLRLYPAYLSSIFLIILIYVITGKDFTLKEVVVNIVPFLRNFSDEFIHSINGNFWFLHTLLQFYLMFPFLVIMFRKFDNKCLFVFLSIFISFLYICFYSFFFHVDSGSLNPASSFFVNYLYDFAFGFFAAHFLRDGNFNVLSSRKFIMFVFFLALFLEGVGFFLYKYFQYGRNFNDLFFSPAILIASYIFYIIFQNSGERVVLALHKYIYDLYLLHHPIFKVIFSFSFSFVYKLIAVIILLPVFVFLNHEIGNIIRNCMEKENVGSVLCSFKNWACWWRNRC